MIITIKKKKVKSFYPCSLDFLPIDIVPVLLENNLFLADYILVKLL